MKMENLLKIRDMRIFKRFIELYKSYLLGLLGGCVVVFLLYVALMKYIGYSLFFKYGLILLGICEFICIIYWLYKNYCIWGKKKRKKLRIVVAIDSGTVYEWFILKNDFIKELKKNVNNKKFKIVILPHIYFNKLCINENQKKLDEEYIKNLNKKVKGHYWICGSVEKQKDEGVKCYIETNAMVFHKKIEQEFKKEFSKEFGKVYEKILRFQDEKYKPGITFSGEYSAVVAKYIIGIAAYISEDFYTAWELHKDLYDDANRIKGMVEKGTTKSENIFRGMIESIKGITWIELKVLTIKTYYSLFDENFDKIYKNKEEWLLERKKWLDEWNENTNKYRDNRAKAHVQSNYAIYEFLSTRNYDKSRKLVKESKGANFAYEYSLIFLDLYAKKYCLARERIEKIIHKKDHNMLEYNFQEIIGFIDIVLNEDEGHEELMYWQAMLFYKKLGMPLYASERLHEYLQWSKGEVKEYEIIPALELQKEIDKTIPVEDETFTYNK